MQAIREWLLKNPADGRKLMHRNPSYVFFKERKNNADEIGPRGALNMPLTPGRSIAVDPRYIPLGAPVWLETTYPSVPPEQLAKARAAERQAAATLVAARPRPRPGVRPITPEARPIRVIATADAATRRGPPLIKPASNEPPPSSDDPQPLRRLLVAQDTGGVIKGPVRGDVYWGTGQIAFLHAGSMNQAGRWFLFLPKGYYGRLPELPPAPSPTAPPAAADRPARPAKRSGGILPKWLRF